MTQHASKAPPDPVIYRLPSILDPIDFSELFTRNQPVEVELGSGDGSFIADYAAANPVRNFIGIERLLGRLRKIGRKGTRLKLENLRAIRIECVYFIRHLLAPSSVAAIHIYFPDPWPKRRHRHNRLVNPEFPKLAERVLVKGGTVFLRTDDRDYYDQMVSVFAADRNFEAFEPCKELLAFKTDFEKEFNARGIPTLAAAYRLL